MLYCYPRGCAWRHSARSHLCVWWMEVLWVSGAAGDWEEELNQASFVDQLSLAQLCHSKLGLLYTEPREVLTCKCRLESSKAPRLPSEMLQSQKWLPEIHLWGGKGTRQPYWRLKCATQSGIMVKDWASVWSSVYFYLQIILDSCVYNWIAGIVNLSQ